MPGRTLVGQTVYGNAASLLAASSQYFHRTIIGNFTNNFTISAWFKLASLGVTRDIYQNGENNSNGYIMRVTSGNNLRVDISFVNSLTGSIALLQDTWYHGVVRREAGVWKLFINGVQDGGTISNNPNGSGGGAVTTVGASRDSGGTASNHFNGLIDDVRFYSRALSDGEIANLFNQGANPTIVVSPANLEGHWKMNESSGNPVDSSGNSRTLTNNNTATFTTGIVTISNVPNRTAAGVRTAAGTRTLAS
jgi:hypothetical protein